MAPHLLADAIDWVPFPGFEGLYYNVLAVDENDRSVEKLMKFDPGIKCVPHRHIGPVKTLVIEGEHQLFDVTDENKQTDCRPAGTFSSHNGDEAHIEGGGAEGAVILLSMTTVGGDVWETYNDDMLVDRVSSATDFRRGIAKQASLHQRPS